MDPVQYRIPWEKGAIVLALCIFLDGVQFVLFFLAFTVVAPFASMLIAIIAWLLLISYFVTSGISFLEGPAVFRKMGALLAGSAGDITPLIGSFVPGMSVACFLMIDASQEEDRIKHAQQKAAQEAKKKAQLERVRAYLAKRKERAEQ